MARYVRMIETEIEQKKKPLQETLDTSHPIDVFFNIINASLI